MRAEILHLSCRWSLSYRESPQFKIRMYNWGFLVLLRPQDGPVLTYILSAGILERSQFFLHLGPGKARGTKKGRIRRWIVFPPSVF